MSVSAKSYLKAHGIKAEHGVCVDMISNRAGNGICPIERSVIDEDDAAAGLAKIAETLAVLANKAM